MLVLIADDDRLVRYSLRSMLEEIRPGIRIEEAEDGEALVAQAARLRPDIAFVDINMPERDGISAIEACRPLSPGTRYVVLTAYADFDYARRCIVLGVTDYILKPASPKALEALLQQLGQEMRQANKKQLAEYQLTVIKAYQRWDKLDHMDGAVEQAADAQYFSFTFFLDAPPGKKSHVEAMEKLFAGLRQWEEALLDVPAFLAAPAPTDQMVRAVVRAEKQHHPAHLAGSAARICMQASGSSCLVSCLVSCAKRLSQLYLQDRWLMQNRHLHLLGVPCQAVPVPAGHGTAPWPAAEMAGLLWELVGHFNRGDWLKYGATLEDLTTRFESLPVGVSLRDVARLASACLGQALEVDSTARFYGALRELQGTAGHLAPVPSAGRMARVKAYINEHYMEDISIASLAEHFGLTPNYLSSLFHEKTGQKFVDYLTGVRIDNAKRILERDADVTVAQVAQMAGYASARYFTRLFKNSTGVYPSDYRRGDTNPAKK